MRSTSRCLVITPPATRDAAWVRPLSVTWPSSTRSCRCWRRAVRPGKRPAVRAPATGAPPRRVCLAAVLWGQPPPRMVEWGMQGAAECWGRGRRQPRSGSWGRGAAWRRHQDGPRLGHRPMPTPGQAPAPWSAAAAAVGWEQRRGAAGAGPGLARRSGAGEGGCLRPQAPACGTGAGPGVLVILG